VLNLVDEAFIANDDVNLREQTATEQSSELCAVDENANVVKCSTHLGDVVTVSSGSEQVSDVFAKSGSASNVSNELAADGQFDDASEAVAGPWYYDFCRGVVDNDGHSAEQRAKLPFQDMSEPYKCAKEMLNGLDLKLSNNEFMNAVLAYESKVGRVPTDDDYSHCELAKQRTSVSAPPHTVALPESSNAQKRTAEHIDKRSVRIQTEPSHRFVNWGLPAGLPLSYVIRVTRRQGTPIKHLVSALEDEYRDSWERGFTADERANVIGAVYLAAAVRRDDEDEMTQWTSAFHLSGNRLPDNEEADANHILHIIHEARSWAIEGQTDECQPPKLHRVDSPERTHRDQGSREHVSAMRSLCASADCANDIACHVGMHHCMQRFAIHSLHYISRLAKRSGGVGFRKLTEFCQPHEAAGDG